MKVTMRPADRLRGEVFMPGDKSITHRALMLSSLASGASRLTGILRGRDCQATIQVLRELGVCAEDLGDAQVVVRGNGLRGWKEPEAVLDCGRSGTTMRLMAGLLAGQDFYSVLAGDRQLLLRPMRRVVDPLREMGGKIWGRAEGACAPLSILGTDLRGIHHQPAVASAQVKSSVLLAGLYAEGETVVTEPGPSRDHLERMLRAREIALSSDGLRHSLRGPVTDLIPMDMNIPGDFSSAAYFIAAALLVPGSKVMIRSVGVNPTRVGFLEGLREMGAEIELLNERDEVGEPVADLLVEHQPLQATRVDKGLVPKMIDEFPLLALVATQAEGVTRVSGAAELRVKETDRIAGTVTSLRALGAEIEERPDGFDVEGPMPLEGTAIASGGDHRLAMMLVIASLIAQGETTIGDVDCIGDSFPGFRQRLEDLGVKGDWSGT